jgi:hypothetical protein
MDYQAHYNRLIERAEQRVLVGYCERHHVVPRCLDKTSKRTVKLTPEEHYVAHQLLVKINPGNPLLVFAVVSMTMTSPSTSLRGNKLYGWLRRAHSVAMSKKLKGRKWSEEERAAHGEQWNKGLETGPLSDAQCAALSAAQRKRYEERPELAANHRAAMKRHFDRVGRKPKLASKPPRPFVPGQAAWNKGKHWSDEVLTSMRKPRSTEGRAAIAVATKKYWADRKAADALLTVEQRLQQTIARLEKRVAKLEALAAQEKADSEVA